MDTHTRLLLLSLAAPLAIATACGGAEKRPAAKRPTVSFADQIKRAAAGGLEAGDAVVTYAIFSPDPAPDDAKAAAKELNERVEEALGHAGGIAPHAPALTPAPKLTLVASSVDDELPLRLETIVEAAGPLAPAVKGARSVRFVRFAGPPGPDATHLWACGVAAATLVGDTDVVADLSLLTVHSAAAWQSAIGAADWVESQITLDAEQADDGAITFRTRGLAKLGLPDLELTDVPPDAARARFETFQSAYAALRAGAKAQIGGTLDGHALRACANSTERYDHECVAIVVSPQRTRGN